MLYILQLIIYFEQSLSKTTRGIIFYLKKLVLFYKAIFELIHGKKYLTLVNTVPCPQLIPHEIRPLKYHLESVDDLTTNGPPLSPFKQTFVIRKIKTQSIKNIYLTCSAIWTTFSSTYLWIRVKEIDSILVFTFIARKNWNRALHFFHCYRSTKKLGSFMNNKLISKINF